uniref:Glycosyltransferase 2-like domain-containing protein n=1 Tax=Cyprinus carpio TaxID=7962 RepID=A0A8C1VAM1_CYPCA
MLFRCSENLVHDDLPSTSVIFCFVDEVWSTLLRSVHSVLNRSPPHLLKEIILVDDSLRQFAEVRIIHLKERQGLIRARIAGAAAARGTVHSHSSYFYELGAYDPGLDVWGGENMEISFNIWMCGGEIEIIPCSRVGHIFRGDNPYNFPKNRVKTVERNLARVLFYGHGYHHLLDKTEIGNLTEQIELRKKLKCKSFKWYLENVYPDLDAPLVKAEGLVGRKKKKTLYHYHFKKIFHSLNTPNTSIANAGFSNSHDAAMSGRCCVYLGESKSTLLGLPKVDAFRNL